MTEPLTNPKRKILLIEDEGAILTFLRAALEAGGWEVLEARTGRNGLAVAAARQPHAILLDLGLPDQDGLSVLKALRQWTSVPILIISARGEDYDKVRGLNAGADDYLAKPFGIAELLARLRVALRHAASRPRDTAPIYEYAGLKVDLIQRRVWLRKKDVHFSPLQHDVLAVLIRHAGRVVRHAQLMKEVWGAGREVTPEAIRILVHQLRRKIEADPLRPRFLKTEPGVGYCLVSPHDGS